MHLRSPATRLTALALLILGATLPSPATPSVPPAIARAVCGPGSLPEPTTQAQGRVTQQDLNQGTGRHCNLELVGHEGDLAGFRTWRYVDAAGRVCAYYDSTPYLQTRARSSYKNLDFQGTHVLDVTDPAHPRRIGSLETPAMASPHESLNVNYRRGLLAADLGNLATGPGFVDVYSIRADCRHPKLQFSLPIGGLGHEGAFSPDGNTFWVSAPWGIYANRNIGNLTAIDISIPRAPRVIWTATHYLAHGFNLSPDGNRLYYGDLGTNRGLTILDVSQVQARTLLPKVTVLSHLTWPEVSLPQTDIPISIGGHPYLFEVDEFTHDTISNFFTHKSFTRPEDMVGAARIIDIADVTHPRVVSNIRLEVNQPAARVGAQSSDPGANTATSYTAHYCAVPRANDPGIVACGFNLSGLRVFDIHDPANPREIAYFNPPTSTPTVPYQAMSAAAFDPAHQQIWYTDANYGFYVLRVTNGVWTP